MAAFRSTTNQCLQQKKILLSDSARNSTLPQSYQERRLPLSSRGAGVQDDAERHYDHARDRWQWKRLPLHRLSTPNRRATFSRMGCHLHVQRNGELSAFTYVYITTLILDKYIYVYVCTSMYKCMYVCTCIYVCLYVCMYVWICICTTIKQLIYSNSYFVSVAIQRGLVHLESVTFTIEQHKEAVFSQTTAHGSLWTHQAERHAPFADISATDCATTGRHI